MRLEWIEDILAVAETGSFIKAAEKRCLTQSAFSRRIRTIEDQLGTELFDRSRKPVELKAAVRERREEMAEIAAGLRRLASDLQREGRLTHRRIVIASQHAITTSIAPSLVRQLLSSDDLDIRLRSANRDECYALLLTRQADIVLFHSTDRHPLALESTFVELHTLGFENLIPVFSKTKLPDLEASLAQNQLPVVVYPESVFLGRVLRDEIWLRFPGMAFKSVAETALTLAAVQFAMIGVAVAWVPETLARAPVQAAELVDLRTLLGMQRLELIAARLKGVHSQTEQEVWSSIVFHGSELLLSMSDPLKTAVTHARPAALR